MAEDLQLDKTLTKRQRYEQLLPQIKGLLTGEDDLIANLANVSAALKEAFNFWWVGFYLVKDDQLVLGPFQGPVACTRIPFSKGVCGACYSQKQTIIVDNVDEFPGHIACSSLSKSEIVVPIWKNDDVVAILDVDSEHLAHFDSVDQEFLEQIRTLI